MTHRRIALSVLIFSLVASVAIAQQPTKEDPLFVGVPKVANLKAETALDEALYGYQIFDLDLRGMAKQVRKTGRLSVYLGNQRFDLELEKNDLRAPGFTAELMNEAGEAVPQKLGFMGTYKGHVAGDPASIVRLTVLPKLFAGYIRTGQDWVFIDPIADYHKGTNSRAVVVYREADAKGGHAGGCGVADHHHVRVPAPYADFVQGLEFETKMANTLQVATECDGQYWADFGTGSWSRIQGILNAVDGIYQSEISTSVTITNQQCWSSISGDPYTSLNAETSLNQFRSWWQANKGGTVRDAAHKFSGKNFSGSTIGIAWVGVICNRPDLSYGISQDISGTAARRRLTAHEIGHNLSAGHDNEAPVCSGVSCNGNGPIMCSFVQTGGSSAADDFSNCSLSSINGHINAFGSCL